MNRKNPNTKEILDAIKNMMSEDPAQNDQQLPKDVIELTNPVNEVKDFRDDKIDILELTDPIDYNENVAAEEEKFNKDQITESLISDVNLKKAVRDAINSMPSSKLNKIINEELTKIIQEKLKSSKITISSENKNN
tara:strand:+ start:366 stop:773 length:408 start_codon:yes stop_codon:yes gene_type:complete